VREAAGTPGGGRRSFARAVFGGAGLLAAAGVVTKLFGLASSPILTRLVGPSPYGLVALAGTISSLATTVAMMGVDLSYARFYFDGGGEQGEAVERFCWRFSLGTGLVVSLLAGAGWWWGSATVAGPGDLAAVVAAGTFTAVATSMATTRQRVRGSYFRIAVAMVGGGGTAVGLSVLFALRWRPDAWAMLVGALAGSVATVAILGIPAPETLLRSSGLSPERRRDLLRMGTASAVTAPLFWVMNSADRWFLGAWSGQGQLGVYSFAAGIGLTGLLLNTAVTLAWFPEMSKEFESSREHAPASIGRLWGRLATLHMVAWLAVAAAGGDLILLLADRRFHSGASLVPWLAGGVFFYGMAALANTGLVLRKNLAPTVAWWVAGAVTNVTFNALLVWRMGPIGAALAACLSYALIAAGMTWSAQSRLYLPIPWGKLIAAAVLTLVAGVWMQAPWSPSPLRSLLVKFPAGATVATVLAGIVAPDWVKSFIRGEFWRGSTG
jgi:O-antigen/teichoic acid export membrane protein